MLKFYTDGASTMKKINNEWIRCNGGAAMVCINDENKIIYAEMTGYQVVSLDASDERIHTRHI